MSASNLPTVFHGLGEFAFVHHRALNSPQTLRDACEAAARRPDLVHVAEGDLCWQKTGSTFVFYFRHPKLVVDHLSRRRLERSDVRDQLFLLSDLLADPPPNMRFIFELKVGGGHPAEAMQHLARMLTALPTERYWVSAFSPSLLRELKRARPEIPTSLHTKLIWRDRVLCTAPERQALSLSRASRLTEVDTVTLSYGTHWPRLMRSLGVEMDDAWAQLEQVGKPVIVCGLKRPQQFLAARDSSAIAGYARFPVDALPSAVTMDEEIPPPGHMRRRPRRWRRKVRRQTAVGAE